MIVYVPSSSMENTVPSGSFVIGIRLYGRRHLERGDIVIFNHTDPALTPNRHYLKRIAGLPGDIIGIQEGVVNINNVPYEEPWLKEAPEQSDYASYVVPENSYFLLGDNRNNSMDSRYWIQSPAVLDSNIMAKAVFLITDKGGYFL